MYLLQILNIFYEMFYGFDIGMSLNAFNHLMILWREGWSIALHFVFSFKMKFLHFIFFFSFKMKFHMNDMTFFASKAKMYIELVIYNFPLCT